MRSVGGEDLKEEAGGRRLWWLVGARMAVATVLLAVGALWAGDWFGNVERGATRVMVPFVSVVFALTLVYAAALHFALVRQRIQAGAQLLFDVLLVSWLVWASGYSRSPYVALYIVIISVSSIFLGARGALLTSVGCAVGYTSVMLGITFGWLATPRGAAFTVAEAVEAIGLNVIAFFVVGLLSARLAARQSRSDVQLIEATHALTNLRELHERIVESIRSGVVTTDLEGRIYTFNAAAEEMTGYTASSLRGEHVSILLGDIRDKIEGSLHAAKERAVTVTTNPRFEAECLTAEGLRLRLGYSISPLFSEGGETTGLVITFQDLTHVRAMEETSRRQDRLAAVGRVAAGIAHEIRNPLAAMRGSIQVLRGELNGDSGQAELMEIVLRESDRLNRIITDFLTYARPRPVALAEIDIREPLRETFTLLRHSPELRDGQIVEDDLPDEPVMALADAAGIKQVFWNLARNALGAMPDGGRLHAELRRTAHGRLRLTFTDTGCGMSPEQVERLFEPFSSSTTGSTGLGLSIVYQIVRDHGGTINVRSREGHGTTITVELPPASQAVEVKS